MMEGLREHMDQEMTARVELGEQRLEECSSVEGGRAVGLKCRCH